MWSPPSRNSYDVVIVGGALIGTSIAWFLARHPGFGGSLLVVERDPTYERASTSLAASSIRQQFSTPLNIRISQFAAEFIRNFREYIGDGPEVPDIELRSFGYMYLAGDDAAAETLRANHAVQVAHGAGTKLMTPGEIAEAYPFYNVDDIVCGSHNLVDEGFFDSGTMFDALRRSARSRGVEYAHGEVAGIGVDGGAVHSVTLASGERIACGTLVNAAGPRAGQLAGLAGLGLPVEPRKRFVFVFTAAEPLDRDLPLTIDPSGVYVRSEGGAYLAGCGPDVDRAVDPDDFVLDPHVFDDKVWPALAHRVPAFDRIRVTAQWAGHYAYNTLDQNVVVGPHHEVGNFVFANGFSGHGLQQAPAIGRGVAELIVDGAYRTLDLSPLGYERIVACAPYVETAII